MPEYYKYLWEMSEYLRRLRVVLNDETLYFVIYCLSEEMLRVIRSKRYYGCR